MKTILVVDDNAEMLQILHALLGPEGYQVIAAENGVSALHVLRAGKQVDLLITDYRMPGMDGLELLLLARQLVPSLPVVVITAHATTDTYMRALSLGAAEYLEKPGLVQTLGPVVGRLLRQSADTAVME